MRTKLAPLLLVPVFLAGAANAQAPRSTPIRKLPDSMKLEASVLASLPAPSLVSPYDGVDKALATAKASLDALKSAQEKLLVSAASCRNKSFTQQDMKTAGCLDTDTVAICSKGLFNQCVLVPHEAYFNANYTFEIASAKFHEVAAKAVALPDPAWLK